jgi:peptide/nickel transport system substrate-binding protein
MFLDGEEPVSGRDAFDPELTERRDTDMHKRLWLSVTMLVTGASLLVAASLAGAGTSAPTVKKGGIWKYGATGASVEVDPQVAYITTAWWLQHATSARLYHYPDKTGAAGQKLVPEVASSFRVSNRGKRYTFTLRRGFRFSDGSAVTGRNFKFAIDRSANKDLASPAAQFIIDPHGSEIVGAKAVNEGDAQSVRGVQVRGNRLIINLTKADATFLAKITMPFFAATHTKLPLTREVTTINSITDLPSAGPYAYSRNEVNRLTSIRQNPFYRRGPGRQRPRNLQGLDIQWGLNEQTAFNQVKSGELDEVQPPPAEIEGLVNQYGVNRSRFHAKPQNCTGYLPLNTANALFRGNVKLRQAVNYAINRRSYVLQAGPLAGDPWTHLLNPAVPGWRSTRLYTQNLTRAKQLAGDLSNKKITIYYRSTPASNVNQYQVVRQDLLNLGFRSDNITARGFSGGQIYTAMGRRGTDADIGTSMGWCSDYPDGYDWLNILLYGPFIQDENNVNFSYFNSNFWNKKMEAAAKLTGPARARRYGQLDLDIMNKAAPVAVERTYKTRYFFSNNVDTRALVYQPIYADWAIPALALK